MLAQPSRTASRSLAWTFDPADDDDGLDPAVTWRYPSWSQPEVAVGSSPGCAARSPGSPASRQVHGKITPLLAGRRDVAAGLVDDADLVYGAGLRG
jgi:hypothetical protein